MLAVRFAGLHCMFTAGFDFITGFINFLLESTICVIYLCMVQDIMSIRPPAQQLQRWLRKERWVPCLAVAASGTCLQ